MSEAFVSLATNDDYAMGALTLGRSLRDVNTTKRLVLLVTNGVTPCMRDSLQSLWDELEDIEELDSRDGEHLRLLNRPELGVTFTKLHAWRLVRYDKCVFLDADTFALCNVDELFEREELSAAPDVGWPDCFNSGVFVYKPSLETFERLLELAINEGSFDGGDQGLLNAFWSDWATNDIKYHLPFVYNVTPNMYYQYAPAYKRFGKNARIIHFIGPLKPWHHTYLPESDSVIPIPNSAYQHSSEHLLRWWRIYQSTRPQPPPDHSTSSQGDPADVPAPGTGRGPSPHSSGTTPSWHHHPGDHRSPSPAHSHRTGSPSYRSPSHRRSPVPPYRRSPVPNYCNASPVSYHNVTGQPIRTRSPMPSMRQRTTSPAPYIPPARTRTPTPGSGQPDVDRRSSSRESSTEPLVRRRQAWQRGDIDYLGADSYEAFIAPSLTPAPVDRKLAWQRGDIDYLGADNYEAFIERFLFDTMNMHLMDDEFDEEHYDDIESFDW